MELSSCSSSLKSSSYFSVIPTAAKPARVTYRYDRTDDTQVIRLIITHISWGTFMSHSDKPSCIEEATYDLCFDDPFYRRLQKLVGNDKVIRQGNKQLIVHYNQQPPAKRSVLVPVFIGAVCTLLIVLGINALVHWWSDWRTDTVYGYPRIWQTDAVVGHNDSEQRPSHFIFQNLHGRILIMEISGDDPAHARIYAGPTIL
jgi:hypothetical protein